MILVTGAKKNIGNELVRQLLNAGFSLKLTHSSNDDLSQWQKYADRIQFIPTHILDATEVYDAVKDVEAVFHCDIIDEYQAVSYESRMKYNIEGTANVVNAMLYHGVQKIIFFSTLKSIITIPTKTSDENTIDEINEWTTEFALSMILAEREIWRGNAEGLEINIIHSADVLVKNSSENNIYSEAVESLKSGKVEIYPSSINYVDVEDVAQLSLKIFQGNHWNASWLALGGNVSREIFYQLIAESQSLNFKFKIVESYTFKIIQDILKKLFLQKERTFRKANGKFLMTEFQFNNQLTTETFEMKWNSLENWLTKNSTKTNP